MNARGSGSMVLGALCAFVATMGVVVGGLLLAAAPALAAAPETPELTVESVTATTATFHGVLSQVEAVEPNELGGTYRFLYKASRTECTGGRVTKPSALFFGGVHEEVFYAVSGLLANTEYEVCLSVTNLEGETTVSAPVQFATRAAPEKPETKAASTVTATSAVLEGTLDPHGMVSAKAGWYFAYDEGSSCMGAGEQRTVQEPEVEGAALPEKTEVTNLEPDRTYRVCLVATDEVGDAVAGNEVVVKTLAPAPEVVAGAVSYSNATPFEATLHAEVDAENQATTVYFQYSTSPVLVGKSLATPTDVPAAPGNSIGSGYPNVGVEDGTGAVLAAGTVYYYQAVAVNPTGTTYGAVEHFETLGVPTAQTGAAEEVTAASAELGGQLDAGGEAEYYVEYGTNPCSANSCGTKSAATQVSGNAQASVAPITVTGLEPNTTYHYWLVANNAAVSKPVHGAAEEFTTKPAPLTGPAEDLTPTSAQITGELNPGGGGQAEYWVEYLLPSGEVQKSVIAIASGNTLASVTPIVLSGLEPNTTYYYWLVAKSSAVSEPVRGEARQFTTPISQAEVEAQAAANRKPAEELAAATAAKQRLEAEEAKRVEEAAEANAAKQKQYGEIETETAGLQRLQAQAGKTNAKAKKAKPKPASCRKGSVKKKNKCVSKKSKKKKKKK